MAVSTNAYLLRRPAGLPANALSNKQHGIGRVGATLTMVGSSVEMLNRSPTHRHFGDTSFPAHATPTACPLKRRHEPSRRLAKPRCSDPRCRSAAAGVFIAISYSSSDGTGTI